MNHRPISSHILHILLGLMLFLSLRGPFNPWIPEARGSQDLDWKLVGTATGNDPRKSYAIMEYLPAGSQGSCREGDRLGDIVIKKILPGRIVIDRGRGDEVLSMDSGTRATGPAPSPPVPRLDRREVDPMLPDFMQLMREIRVRPHLEAGRPGGFLIYNIDPDSIFARAGLENGDVIVSVNGISTATTQRATELYDALKKGGAVGLEVKRGGSKQELHFVIQ
jgi:general secretion pathway protein C